MSKNQLNLFLQKYQKKAKSAKKHQDYFSIFERKMLYRTTKTENPKTTMFMVKKVLGNLANKVL